MNARIGIITSTTGMRETRRRRLLSERIPRVRLAHDPEVAFACPTSIIEDEHIIIDLDDDAPHQEMIDSLIDLILGDSETSEVSEDLVETRRFACGPKAFHLHQDVLCHDRQQWVIKMMISWDEGEEVTHWAGLGFRFRCVLIWYPELDGRWCIEIECIEQIPLAIMHLRRRFHSLEESFDAVDALLMMQPLPS